MASFGYHEIGRLLLDQCAEVNKSDEHGQTPLHIAVFMGKVEMVRLLLEHNADVNKADNLVKFNYQRIVIMIVLLSLNPCFLLHRGIGTNLTTHGSRCTHYQGRC